MSLRLAPRCHMDPNHLTTTPAPRVAPTGPTMILVYDQKLKPLQASQMGRLSPQKNKMAIERKGKNQKEVMKSEKYCGKTATLPVQGSANKPPGITLLDPTNTYLRWFSSLYGVVCALIYNIFSLTYLLALRRFPGYGSGRHGVVLMCRHCILHRI